MKFIPNSVYRTLARQALIAQKNSPTILFVGGVTLAVTSTVLACRSTRKFDEVIASVNEDVKKAKKARNIALNPTNHVDYTDMDYRRDLGIVYVNAAVRLAKLYGPAIGVGVLAIAALTGSNRILTRRNAALTTAYVMVERAFKEYRQRVVDELGEEKDREFRYSSESKTIVEELPSGQMKKSEVVRVGPDVPTQYARFFDQLNKNWVKTPEYNFMFVRLQQQYANDLLNSRGHVFLNDVYDLLGMDRSSAGSVVGWVRDNKNGDNFIDFGVFDGDNPKARDFVNGREGSILLDFNVDGVIYDLLDKIQ